MTGSLYVDFRTKAVKPCLILRAFSITEIAFNGLLIPVKNGEDVSLDIFSFNDELNIAFILR
jgi:hypothetical protein